MAVANSGIDNEAATKTEATAFVQMLVEGDSERPLHLGAVGLAELRRVQPQQYAEEPNRDRVFHESSGVAALE